MLFISYVLLLVRFVHRLVCVWWVKLRHALLGMLYINFITLSYILIGLYNYSHEYINSTKT